MYRTFIVKKIVVQNRFVFKALTAYFGRQVLRYTYSYIERKPRQEVSLLL